jgi:hypothetical protein
MDLFNILGQVEFYFYTSEGYHNMELITVSEMNNTITIEVCFTQQLFAQQFLQTLLPRVYLQPLFNFSKISV